MAKKHIPSLNDLENYDFEKLKKRECFTCKEKTKQEIYDGHTFSEGSKMAVCLICGQRELI